MLRMEFNDICISQLRFDLLVTPTVGKKLQTNVMLSLSVMCVFKFCLSPFNIYIYIYFCCCLFGCFVLFSVTTLSSNREQFSLSNGYTAYLYQYQNCIISNKLTCTHCVCAFVVLQLQSTNCLPYLNREWHNVLSTAIVQSFFFDVVRLQTTNQMLLCFHTQLSCNAHIHMHVIIWGNVYITCIQCTKAYTQKRSKSNTTNLHST